MKQALITFFDPFTATLIKPPSIPILSFVGGDSWDDECYLYYFEKFIFSNGAWPSSSSSDLQVAMIYDLYKYIAFWRPGQQQWIKPNMDIDVRQIEDVCFFKGEFYSIDIYSRVIAFGSELPKRPPRIIADLKSQGLVPCAHRYYIVAFDQNESTLLIVHKDVYELPDVYNTNNNNAAWNWTESFHLIELNVEVPDVYNTNNNNAARNWTESFQLIELNVDDGKAKLIHNLGNRALFVGYNSTFFVDSLSDQCKRGCRPNSIYFTDDNYEKYYTLGGGKDIGIFCLREGKRIEQPLYEGGPSQCSYVAPPTWVELPHY
ncbi:uncharacterized protein LOC130591282 [Beta vulgaris subsp. vulgaris]|uniref:uncharacterized protein LOC130591282 n=1 Tax=Beta vulgaris subsp. vulgaris TaxID=3555 RepID=UPI002548C981|nr:uncharacterized protein LOC130591282 [Beta vulgaris subsp. vulgaris]